MDEGHLAFADGGVKHVLQSCAFELELINFLVRRELNFFLESADDVVQLVIFLKHLAEVIVSEPQPADGFAIFGKFTQERMMYVHWKPLG
jgi:hypothetical protein